MGASISLRWCKPLMTQEDVLGDLGEIWHGQYVIENTETGERVMVSTRDKRKN